MLGFIATWLLVSCGGADKATKEVPTPPSTPANREHWELIGTVGPKASSFPSPAPFEGGRALVDRCKDRRPCGAERWRSESGQTFNMVLIERTYHFEDGRPSWPAQWVAITGTLRACLGDPLSIPPTDDPEAVRTLMVAGETAEWWLHFSGNNSCGLEGLIRLDAKGPDVHLDALRCEGKRWREGGRECAQAHLKAARTR